MGEDGCGLSVGLTLSSGLPDASPRIPASATELLDTFLLSRRSCQISLPSVGTRSYVGPRILPALPMPQSNFLKQSFR